MAGFSRIFGKKSPKIDDSSDKSYGLLNERLSKLESLAVAAEDIQEIKRCVQALLASQTVYLGDYEAMTSTRHGDRIYVDTRSTGIASHLIWTGKWEPRIEAALDERIHPGDTVCDFGANFGFYTLSFARMVGSKGRIISVEANPPIYQKLKKSVHVNGYAKRTTIHNLALADQNGMLEFRVDSEYSGGGSLVFKGAQGSIQVKARRVDDLIPAETHVNVIKMDVEGAEALVLAGGHRLFSSPSLRAIVMEFTPAAVAKFQPPQEFLAWFQAQGYRLRVFGGEGLTGPKTPSEIVAMNMPMMNFIAEKP